MELRKIQILLSSLPKIREKFPKLQASTLLILLNLVYYVSFYKNVNLHYLKDYAPSGSDLANLKANSRYVKFIRFFKDKELSNLVKLVLYLIHYFLKDRIKNREYILDRTNWSKGDKEINLMVLSLVVNKVAYPIYWEELGKKGVSSILEQKSFLDAARKYYDLSDSLFLADREFVSYELANYLSINGIDFSIRSKKNWFKKEINKKNRKAYANLLKRADKYQYSSAMIKLGDKYFYIYVTRNRNVNNEKDKYIFILSNNSNAKLALSRYLVRWKIEVMFKYMKTCGFHLEKINFTDPEKIEMMTAITALAYIMTVEIVPEEEQIKNLQKPHPNNEKIYPEKSIFSKGIEILYQNFANIGLFFEYFYLLFFNLKTADYQELIDNQN